jgi:hypothetical protein
MRSRSSSTPVASSIDVALSVATRLITHRVARKPCRSHVESGTNLAESATVLFTELLWKRSGCGKGGVLIPGGALLRRTEESGEAFSAERIRLVPSWLAALLR